jgi:hypothetical protein
MTPSVVPQLIFILIFIIIFLVIFHIVKTKWNEIYNSYIKIKPSIVMNKKLLSIGTTISILILAISTNRLLAQNTTTNASNAAGNMTAAANQAASELGQSASSDWTRQVTK